MAAFAGGRVAKESPVVFHKDVAPILQKHCQGCHRPGEAAPMSLLTYKEARPWAAAIREAVILKRMLMRTISILRRSLNTMLVRHIVIMLCNISWA